MMTRYVVNLFVEVEPQFKMFSSICLSCFLYALLLQFCFVLVLVTLYFPLWVAWGAQRMNCKLSTLTKMTESIDVVLEHEFG